MGLDMYLNRAPRCDISMQDISNVEEYFNWRDKKKDSSSDARKWTLKKWCGVDFKELPSKKARNYLEQFYKFGYSYWDYEKKYSGRNRIIENVGYERKANQIHNWFVENVQNGEDDCQYHDEVTKEKLEELLNICKQIKEKCPMVDGRVANGAIYKNGKWDESYEDGKVMTNSDFAKKLLPSVDGCFFGGVNYDQWYMQSIDDTIEICEKILSETDFETQMIYYVSSW